MVRQQWNVTTACQFNSVINYLLLAFPVVAEAVACADAVRALAVVVAVESVDCDALACPDAAKEHVLH